MSPQSCSHTPQVETVQNHFLSCWHQCPVQMANGLDQSGSARIGAEISYVFKALKACVHLEVHVKYYSFLCWWVQWFCHGGKILDESAVVICQTQELLNFLG